jgi:hypothetical protein
MAFAIGRPIWMGKASFGCGSTFHFSHPLFHFLARLERDDEFLRYKHFVAGTRIPGLACGPTFYLENAEISEFNAVIFNERLDDRIERFLDDFLRLKLCQTDLFGDGFDNLFLGHVGSPLRGGHWREKAADWR